MMQHVCTLHCVPLKTMVNIDDRHVKCKAAIKNGCKYDMITRRYKLWSQE